MVISGVSMQDYLATLATRNASNDVSSQIAAAVLKQVMQQNQQQGQAIVEMIQSMSLDGTGQLIDISA
jgi:hypothetical protein